MPVPPARIRAINDRPLQAERDYVLYWMTSARRTRDSFGLQRAVELSQEVHKPLLVFEPLRVAYPWASDRFHAFVIQGMADNAARFEASGVTYFPYLEPAAGADKGLLATLAQRAAAVVTDDYPCYFLPQLLAAGSRAVDGRLEAVDGNGLLPMRATEQVFPSAYAFRRHLQKTLPAALREVPLPDPLKHYRGGAAQLPRSVAQRWPPVARVELAAGSVDLAAFPIDHQVKPGLRLGGERPAHETLKTFVQQHLEHYAAERSQPEANRVSGLSAYLHFGQLSVHSVLAEVGRSAGWSLDKLGAIRSGQREGFWNVSPAADGFLDELVTWRELGFNFTSHRSDYDQFESLPPWAKDSLQKHTADPRPQLYTFEQLEHGLTADSLWNAAQLQMVQEGYMHNYLRMLWGKKVLQWSKSPEQALETLIALNNKYELDGRDPNTYSGIFWVFGRYDRPWGPERPIFGVIRYMTSENTARKFKVDRYIQRYTGRQTQLL